MPNISSPMSFRHDTGRLSDLVYSAAASSCCGHHPDAHDGVGCLLRGCGCRVAFASLLALGEVVYPTTQYEPLEVRGMELSERQGDLAKRAEARASAERRARLRRYRRSVERARVVAEQGVA